MSTTFEQVRNALKKAENVGKKIERLEKQLAEAEADRRAALDEVAAIVEKQKAGGKTIYDAPVETAEEVIA